MEFLRFLAYAVGLAVLGFGVGFLVFKLIFESKLKGRFGDVMFFVALLGPAIATFTLIQRQWHDVTLTVLLGLAFTVAYVAGGIFVFRGLKA